MPFLIPWVNSMLKGSGKRHASEPVQVFAVTGGKGGVGKTSISVNLSIALADRGRDVTLLDADLGLANIAVLLGLHPLRDLSHVVSGECSLHDIVVKGPNGINIVPASSGIKMMSQLTTAQHSALVSAFDALEDMTDTLIIDTSAGLSDSVLSFCSASQEIIIVVCNEPASITDAYALIKILNKDHGIDRFRVVVNMAESAEEARQLFLRLVRVTGKYLDVVLDFTGKIPRDKYLLKSVQQQRPLMLAYPGAPSAIALKELAQIADKWPRKCAANGKLEFFIGSMVRALPVNQYGVHI